jgi:hypothetical protein
VKLEKVKKTMPTTTIKSKLTPRTLTTLAVMLTAAFIGGAGVHEALQVEAPAEPTELVCHTYGREPRCERADDGSATCCDALGCHTWPAFPSCHQVAPTVFVCCGPEIQ